MSDVFATLSQELPWLRSLATRLAQGDRDEAEDLVQDTLQVAWERTPPEQALQPPILGSRTSRSACNEFSNAASAPAANSRKTLHEQRAAGGGVPRGAAPEWSSADFRDVRHPFVAVTSQPMSLPTMRH